LYKFEVRGNKKDSKGEGKKEQERRRLVGLNDWSEGKRSPMLGKKTESSAIMGVMKGKKKKPKESSVGCTLSDANSSLYSKPQKGGAWARAGFRWS